MLSNFVISHFCYRVQRSCGQGNVFTRVFHSVHREGGSASVYAGIPPTSPPGPDPPPLAHPHGKLPLAHPPLAHPLSGTPPLAHHPWHTPPEADPGIRSMSGRYASYWNAFLYILVYF